MVVELKGSVKEIYNEQHISDNFSKRDFLVTIDEDGKYPQDILIEATNSKIDALKSIKVGNKVIVKCNLRSRSWVDNKKQTKHFLSLNLWEIENKTEQD